MHATVFCLISHFRQDELQNCKKKKKKKGGTGFIVTSKGNVHLHYRRRQVRHPWGTAQLKTQDLLWKSARTICGGVGGLNDELGNCRHNDGRRLTLKPRKGITGRVWGRRRDGQRGRRWSREVVNERQVLRMRSLSGLNAAQIQCSLRRQPHSMRQFQTVFQTRGNKHPQ